MPCPITATMHLGAIENNLQVVRRFAPGAKVWAVVKANAYGHGINHVWRSMAQNRRLRHAGSGRSGAVARIVGKGRFYCWKVSSSRRIWRCSIVIA